jgi:transcriptional regulator of aromatic amino acid metabolism
MDRMERTLEDTAAVLGTDAGGLLVATRVQIRVVEGPDAGTSLLLERGSIVVGSGPGADLFLRDERVSRAHLELAVMPRGVRVRDLGSRNGSFAGETRLRDATLPIGTSIRIGRTLLELGADTVPVQVVPRSALGPLRAASSALRHVFGTAAQALASRAAILIEGEAGVGKTALARAIHELGTGALQEIDLRSSDPRTLERDVIAALAALGAAGTLSLEHVDEASAASQRALAAALDRRDHDRPGPRLIATSREDLRQRVTEGAFDRGLYFELGAVRLAISPLRDRPEDVLPIVEALVGAGVGARPTTSMLEAFRRSGMEGNARALRGLVETSLRPSVEAPPDRAFVEPLPLDAGFKEAKDQAVASFERDYLVRLLAGCDGNVSEASRRSGVARSHLVNLLKKHGLG